MPDFTVRCFRCFHVRVFQFFKAGTSRLGTAYGDFDFSKAGFRASKPSAAVFIFQKTSASRLKNIHDGLNVFQKPALHASKPSTVVLIFQKSALHASIPPTAVPIYSKTGDSRRKNSVCCSLKKTQ